MAKASAYFGRLRQRLWNNHHVSMRVKGKIFRAIVHLRSIMMITWMDKMINKEIL